MALASTVWFTSSKYSPVISTSDTQSTSVIRALSISDCEKSGISRSVIWFAEFPKMNKLLILHWHTKQIKAELLAPWVIVLLIRLNMEHSELTVELRTMSPFALQLTTESCEMYVSASPDSTQSSKAPASSEREFEEQFSRSRIRFACIICITSCESEYPVLPHSRVQTSLQTCQPVQSDW